MVMGSGIMAHMEDYKKPVGRPSDYNPENAILICEKIAAGMSLRDICSLENMPDKSTVFRWLYLSSEFKDLYACAREAQSEVYAQDMTDLADNCHLSPEAINKAKLQIDTRKWIASKLKPKKYGDNLTVKGDKDNPLQINIASQLSERIERYRKTIENEKNPDTLAGFLPVIDVSDKTPSG